MQEVEEIITKKRNCKTATAIRAARKKIIQRAELSKTLGTKSNPNITSAARLLKYEPTIDAALQSRYQEARQFWLFIVDPEAYRQEEAALQYNFDQASRALTYATRENPYDHSALQGEAAAKKHPYDFS